jgi:hypothetical protein
MAEYPQRNMREDVQEEIQSAPMLQKHRFALAIEAMRETNPPSGRIYERP